MSIKEKILKQTYFIAEIGINHNGDLSNAIKLIEAAKFAGCDAVKFQKRTRNLCTKRSMVYYQRNPWEIKIY